MRQSLHRLRDLVVVVVTTGLLGSCAGRPEGVLLPVTMSAPGTTTVDMAVATTRSRAENRAVLFTGERGTQLDFANIVVSIPPDSVRKVGDVQWPKRIPGNPATDFVTVKAEDMSLPEAKAWFNSRIKKTKGRQALVFIHGFNNRFDDAVYRFAQIVHDSNAPVVPILFTWPSRGSILAYGYDFQSTNYSRDALEQLLTALAENPNVDEVSILAHSMGNWVALEALRQMAIRNGRVLPKIKNVMLASPDVDVDVFRSQMVDIGKKGPNITLFVSQDDRALAASRRVWGNVERLGQINPTLEPYATELKQDKITVIDLTKLKTDDKLNHGKFAASPEVVQAIGARLADGQAISDSRIGLGDRIIAASTGAAATVGAAAGVVVSAPVAIIDPNTRNNLDENVQALGDAVTDSASATTDMVKGAAEVGQ
ncbi:Esterase/lipase superfamily enzyme [Kaistia soli DSM 19436]|uniref:Esterase/lipase superfamily enzyme n=1 Tax=Kaistia soli DSM 19436 TaxID=1122133 RepID=A0A1M5PWN6_9HYPH|nr:alpha/beta hydrolase [Kaistia soli]SHH06204.1 Esterase/lipase superfamily enzyme [Kaistia soli DSM 19436]